MATLAELNTLINTSTAHLNAFKAIALAYEFGSGGVPNIDGSIALVNNAISTNFGAGNSGITFNQENIYINIMNAQIQGNAAAAAKFASVTAGSASLQDKLIAIYNAYVPAGAQTDEGRAYFTRPEAQAFYTQVAADRGVAGPDGAAIVALASLFNILVNEDLGLGDAANDLVAAIGNDTAVLPESGSDFTPIETADGTDFDADDNANPATPINFTAAIGEALVGTSGTDAFSGVIDLTSATSGTVNVGDSVNGLGGDDTLNLLVAVGGAGLPAGFSASGIETVNVTYVDGQNIGALNSATFAGVQELWQIDNDNTTPDFQNVTVGAGVTVGFRSTNDAAATVVNNTVTAANGVNTVSVAVDGVGNGSAVIIGETTAANVSTVNVSGSVASAGGGVPGILNIGMAAATTDIDTLNLSLTSNTQVVAILDDLNTIDATGSTGNILMNLGAPDELTSASFGSGNDQVILATAALGAGTLAIDLGDGNDVITLLAPSNVAANAAAITLGAGNDTLDLDALANVTDITAVAGDLITIADFNAAQDVLDLSGIGPRDVLVNTELANISGAASLEAALAAAAAVTTLNSYSVFNYGGDAYVFKNNGGAGFDNGDGLMKVVGFGVEDITATNFIA